MLRVGRLIQTHLLAIGQHDGRIRQLGIGQLLVNAVRLGQHVAGGGKDRFRLRSQGCGALRSVFFRKKSKRRLSSAFAFEEGIPLWPDPSATISARPRPSSPAIIVCSA